jgi:hypothetical protein
MKPLTLSKVDLYFQYLLATINFCLGVASIADRGTVLLMLTFQMFINLYHFFTNSAHLYAKHRSIVFTKLRDFYSTLSLIYVPSAIFISVAVAKIFSKTDHMGILLLIIWLFIPQIVMHAYIYMCKREIDYLTQREFFIIK